MYNVKIKNRTTGKTKLTGSRVKTFTGAFNRVRRIINSGYVGPVQVLRYNGKHSERVLYFHASQVTIDKIERLNQIIIYCLNNAKTDISIDITNDVIRWVGNV